MLYLNVGLSLEKYLFVYYGNSVSCAEIAFAFCEYSPPQRLAVSGTKYLGIEHGAKRNARWSRLKVRASAKKNTF